MTRLLLKEAMKIILLIPMEENILTAFRLEAIGHHQSLF